MAHQAELEACQAELETRQACDYLLREVDEPPRRLIGKCRTTGQRARVAIDIPEAPDKGHKHRFHDAAPVFDQTFSDGRMQMMNATSAPYTWPGQP